MALTISESELRRFYVVSRSLKLLNGECDRIRKKIIDVAEQRNVEVIKVGKMLATINSEERRYPDLKGAIIHLRGEDYLQKLYDNCKPQEVKKVTVKEVL